MLEARNDFVVVKFVRHDNPITVIVDKNLAEVISTGRDVQSMTCLRGDKVVVDAKNAVPFEIDGVHYAAVRSCDIVSRVVAG